jgi:PBP1b-binding outer membrane lipoprotein LpoB
MSNEMNEIFYSQLSEIFKDAKRRNLNPNGMLDPIVNRMVFDRILTNNIQDTFSRLEVTANQALPSKPPSYPASQQASSSQDNPPSYSLH